MSMSNSESRKREAAQVVPPDVETPAQTLGVEMCHANRYPHMYRGHHNARAYGPCEAHEEVAQWLVTSDWLADHDARLRESIAAEIEALHLNPQNSLTPHCVEEYNGGLENAARIARGGHLVGCNKLQGCDPGCASEATR